MKTKAIKPPPETTKNKYDMPVLGKDKETNTVSHKSDANISIVTTKTNLLEVKISNEKKFVMETEF